MDLNNKQSGVLEILSSMAVQVGQKLLQIFGNVQN